MAMRASDSQVKGSIGVTEVRAEFERLGWGPIPNPDHDVGTDLFVQVRDERGHDLGLMLGIQVKAGPSWFDEAIRDDDGAVRGWWFRDDDRRHIDAWLGHTVPHVIVLRDLEEKVSYWAHIHPDAVEPTGKGAKILVPLTNVVGDEGRDALVAVASTERPPVAWEGSAWNPPTLSGRQLLRHALIAPRLVAPHPNLGYGAGLSSEQAVALLMQGRIFDYERFASGDEEVPALNEAAGSSDWKWRFVGALGTRVLDDELNPLLRSVTDAPSPSARAAAGVAGATALIEQLRIEDAIALLDPLIEDQDLEPVDHAWLLVQRARALGEIGRLNDAEADALAARGVRQPTGDDSTASAIAGTADMLLFSSAPPGEGDLEMAIMGGDTAISWWRAQTTSRGLAAIVERTFSAWSRDTTVTVSANDTAKNELYASALNASHAGDQGAWRYLTKLAGCDLLLRLDEHAHPADAFEGIDALRRAGAVKELAIAVKQVAANGPASAITMATAQVDLQRSTHTTARADLALLQHGGHLTGRETASKAVNNLLSTLDDPAMFAARTRPSYALEDQLATTLAAVVIAASADTQQRVAAHIVALPPHQEQLTAGSWGRVVRALPEKVWTEELSRRAGDVADDHHDALRLPLLGIAARHDDAATAHLLTHAREGSLAALTEVSDVRQLPAEVAGAVIERLGQAADEIIADAHNNKFGFRAYDIGSALAIVNTWHLEAARWDPLLRLLDDQTVRSGSKRIALQTLANLASHLPPDVAARLLPIAGTIAKRETAAPVDIFDGPRDTAGEAANLLVALGGLEMDDSFDRLTDLVAGESGDRRWAAEVAGQTGRPEDVGVLLTLAADDDPHVRAAAAFGLASLVAQNKGGALARRSLERCIEDPGAMVPAHIAGALHIHGGDVAEEFLSMLRKHPSAFVREAAMES